MPIVAKTQRVLGVDKYLIEFKIIILKRAKITALTPPRRFLAAKIRNKRKNNHSRKFSNHTAQPFHKSQRAVSNKAQTDNNSNTFYIEK